MMLDTWGKSRKPTGYYRAIIVAGCRVYSDGRPSPTLEWRVRKAVDLWRLKVAPTLVLTGGKGEGEVSEAAGAGRLAESLGVPRSALLLEEESTSTEENARNAAGQFEDAIHARVIVVTDAYHVFRARRLFDRYFGEVDAVGSTYGVWSRVRGAFREALALCKYLINPQTSSPKKD